LFIKKGPPTWTYGCSGLSGDVASGLGNETRDLVARLTDVNLRGVVLSVVVSLTLEGSKAESEKFELVTGKSHVLDYSTGDTYPVINAEGFTSGQLRPGEVKTLRLTFKAPKDVKTVGINLSGVGSFDDVNLGQ